MATASLSIESASARRKLKALADKALFRLRLQEGINALALSGTIVLWLLVPLVFFEKLVSLSSAGIDIWVILVGLLGLCFPYVLLRAFSSRISARFAAAVADDRLGLNSRLCTALALNPEDDSEFSEAFYMEAAENLAALDPQKAFPLKASKLYSWMLLPSALAAGMFFFMPVTDKLGFMAEKNQRLVAETTKKETLKRFDDKLEELKLDEDESANAESAEFKIKQLVKKAKGIASQVKSGKKNPEGAIIAVAELRREVGEEKEKMLEGKDFLSRLKKLSPQDLNLEENDFTQDFSKALKDGDPSKAAREMRKLARKLREDVLNNDALNAEQKAQAMKKVQNEMERLAGALAEQEALKDNLREVSKDSMDAGNFDSLQEQIEAFKNKNGGKDMEDFADELEEAMDSAADELEQLEDENDDVLEEEEQEALDNLDELDEALEDLMEGMDSGQQCKGGGKGKGKGKSSSSSSGRSSKGKKMSGKSGNSAGGKTGKANGSRGKRGERKNGKKRSGRGAAGPSAGKRTVGGMGIDESMLRDGDVMFKVERVRGHMQSGAITGLSHFRGQGAKGAVPENYIEALKAAENRATSSLELDRIPADARKEVKAYFSNLRKDARGSSPSVSPTPAKKKPATFDSTQSLEE